MKQMKVKGKEKIYGQYLDYIIKDQDISMSCIIKRKKLVGNYTIIVYGKNGRMVNLQLNGKNKDLKDCVVYYVFQKNSIILEEHVYVEFQKINQKKEKIFNADNAVAEDVLLVID